MKAYVITTGAVFGLLALAHVMRIVAEAVLRLHHRRRGGTVRVVALRAAASAGTASLNTGCMEFAALKPFRVR